MKVLTAKEAAKISNRATDPQTLEELLEHIESIAELGFTNTSTVLPSRHTKKAEKIKSKLNELGYKASIDSKYLAPRIFIEIYW